MATVFRVPEARQSFPASPNLRQILQSQHPNHPRDLARKFGDQPLRMLDCALGPVIVVAGHSRYTKVWSVFCKPRRNR